MVIDKVPAADYYIHSVVHSIGGCLEQPAAAVFQQLGSWVVNSQSVNFLSFFPFFSRDSNLLMGHQR